jgi:hypothetical protein
MIAILGQIKQLNCLDRPKGMIIAVRLRRESPTAAGGGPSQTITTRVRRIPYQPLGGRRGATRTVTQQAG